MIFIDLSGLFHLSIYRLEKADVELTQRSLACSLAQSIYWYKKKFEDEYGQVVICCDSKINWRREVFPYYKQRRVEKRHNDEKDWDSIFNIFSLVKADFQAKMQETVLEIEGLEGDDLIALGTKLIKKHPHLILSSDKDMTQLLDSDVRMFHILHQEFAKYDPHAFILQVLKGDRSDGVPSILCEDNHYVDEKAARAKPITKKYTDSIDSLDEDTIRLAFSSFEDVDKIVEHFKRNQTLIDLKKIPSKFVEIFKKEFIKAYNAQKSNDSNKYFAELGINME